MEDDVLNRPPRPLLWALFLDVCLPFSEVRKKMDFGRLWAGAGGRGGGCLKLQILQILQKIQHAMLPLKGVRRIYSGLRPLPPAPLLVLGPPWHSFWYHFWGPGDALKEIGWLLGDLWTSRMVLGAPRCIFYRFGVSFWSPRGTFLRWKASSGPWLFHACFHRGPWMHFYWIFGRTGGLPTWKTMQNRCTVVQNQGSAK